jgi:hypothetical protein
MKNEFVPKSRLSMDRKQSMELDYSFATGPQIYQIYQLPLPLPLDLSADWHPRHIVPHNAFGLAASSPEATISSAPPHPMH